MGSEIQKSKFKHNVQEYFLEGKELDEYDLQKFANFMVHAFDHVCWLRSVISEADWACNVRMCWRAKTLRSIKNKIQNIGRPLNWWEMCDIAGLRLVTTPEDLETVKTRLMHFLDTEEIEYRFIDYVHTPKQSGYRAYHFRLVLDEEFPVEIQLKDMNMDAWSQFVECLDFYRGEDYKHNEEACGQTYAPLMEWLVDKKEPTWQFKKIYESSYKWLTALMNAKTDLETIYYQSDAEYMLTQIIHGQQFNYMYSNDDDLCASYIMALDATQLDAPDLLMCSGSKGRRVFNLYFMESFAKWSTVTNALDPIGNLLDPISSLFKC